MLKNLTSVVLLFVSFPLAAQAPLVDKVKLEILESSARPQDSNFVIANTYGFSVIWDHPSSYRLYATTNNQRKTWRNGNLRDISNMKPERCPIDKDPTSPGWDYRCQEQIGLFSKYVDCGQGSPCEWEGRWDAYPGAQNIGPFPVQGFWPEDFPRIGVDGFTPVLTKDAANSPPICGDGQCPPPTGSTACHKENPDSYIKGVANGKVVEVAYGPGQRRWFMAFNTTIKTKGASAADHFRIAWAHSDDGKNWTPYYKYLLRSVKEGTGGVGVNPTDCRGFGFLLFDMFVDDGLFYLAFQELQGEKVYLARSVIAPYGTNPGYPAWSLRLSGPMVNGKRTWVRFPATGEPLDLEALGAVPIRTTSRGGLKQTDINRIYKPGRSGSGLKAGEDYQYVMLRDEGGTLQIWVADTLNDAFDYQTDVDTSMLTKGVNGWEFAMTQYPDNVDASPRLVADELDLWVTLNRKSESPGAGVTVSRLTAKLTGGIFDAEN